MAVHGSAPRAIAEDPQSGTVDARPHRFGFPWDELQLLTLHVAVEQACARISTDEAVEVDWRGDQTTGGPGETGTDQRRDILERTGRVGLVSVKVGEQAFSDPSAGSVPQA